jgi:hypothetical protein
MLNRAGVQKRLLFILAVLASFPLVAQEKPSFGPTDPLKPMSVDGPESPKLGETVRGRLAITLPLGGIDLIEFPGGKRATLREGKREQPVVREVSGPDRDGNLLVVMNQSSDSALRIERADGGPGFEIARGKDGPGFEFTFDGPCLAPSGGRALVIRDPRKIYMETDPKTTFEEGKLEVWDIAVAGNSAEKAAKRLPFEMTALVWSASWFPDGQSFCIAALIPPQGIPVSAVEDYNEQAIRRRTSLIPVAERRVPAAFQVKLKDGTKTLLQIGRRCVVSSDGESILIQGIGTEWMQRDVRKGTFKRVRWPGVFHGHDHPVRRLSTYEGGPLALLGGDTVVYWGLPTTGAETGVTKNNSPLVGEKPMLTIKAASLADGRFVTLVPSIDPRRKVSFGTPPGK